jgi:biofilm protein TabA
MILDTHDNLPRYASLFRGADAEEVFAWLRVCRDLSPEIRHEFAGDKLFATILRRETLQREAVRWEAHREYVDLQYIIGGGEVIDWAPATGLSAVGDYDADKDVLFYTASPADVSLPMIEGWFAFFFSSDAHRPMISNGSDRLVHKAVVKIHKSLLVL